MNTCWRCKKIRTYKQHDEVSGVHLSIYFFDEGLSRKYLSIAPFRNRTALLQDREVAFHVLAEFLVGVTVAVKQFHTRLSF